MFFKSQFSQIQTVGEGQNKWLGWSSVGVSSLMFLATPTLAQSQVIQPSHFANSNRTSQSTSPSPPPRPIVFTPPAPPDQGSPLGRRQGGATRGSCRDFSGLTALVPVQNKTVIGWTEDDKPNLWFYLPAPLDGSIPAKLVLQDDEDRLISETSVSFQTDSPGVVAIAMEQPEPALEAEQTYRWTMSLYCDPDNPSKAVYVKGLLHRSSEGGVNRQELTLEQAAQDAENGIWFDSLTTLGKLRQADPNNPVIDQAWESLLEQINLSDFASAPILDVETSNRIEISSD